METERLDQVQRQLKESIYLNSPAVIACRFTECKWYRVNLSVVEYEFATLKGSNGEQSSQLQADLSKWLAQYDAMCPGQWKSTSSQGGISKFQVSRESGRVCVSLLAES